MCKSCSARRRINTSRGGANIGTIYGEKKESKRPVATKTGQKRGTDMSVSGTPIGSKGKASNIPAAKTTRRCRHCGNSQQFKGSNYCTKCGKAGL